MKKIYKRLSGGKQKVAPAALFAALKAQGFVEKDPRMIRLGEELAGKDSLDKEDMEALLAEHGFLYKALRRNNVIPDFRRFCSLLSENFSEAGKKEGGRLATYIPQLASIDPSLFAMSICTVDGQVFSLGDYDRKFCAQSCCKPVTYALALEEIGEEAVHRHVGREPSGKSFNELTLNNKGLPHNPLINAGSIMCGSLIRPEESMERRFAMVMEKWKGLTASEAGFDQAVYESERLTADRNFALAYFMREKKAFPEGTDIQATLDFYFRCCSVEIDTIQLAVLAASFANGGVNPLSNEKVFDPATVKDCLSLMNSCGMYDYSGEFAFTIGLPAKSGVSGAIWLVVPNIMGIAVYSPLLDELGNSVKGLEFARLLAKTFNFHNYDLLVSSKNDKIDPTKGKYEARNAEISALLWAAAEGDADEVMRLYAHGVKINKSDYDGRTALHLAVHNGHLSVVSFLLEHKADPFARDRWGNTPCSLASESGSAHIKDMVSSFASTRKSR